MYSYKIFFHYNIFRNREAVEFLYQFANITLNFIQKVNTFLDY